jgi:predicted O-methyltransferase YrrM
MEDQIHEALDRYIGDLFAPEDDLLQQIREDSVAQGMPQIHIHATDGQLIQFLLKAVGARRVVEIGTLAGYSGTWILRGLPPDGTLITLDINPEHARVAAPFLEKAAEGRRVELRVGPAAENLKNLSSDGPYDAVFIDANKDGYPDYLTWAIDNVRSGGLVLAHNAFFGGAIIGVKEREAHLVEGLKSFNQALASEPRLFSTIIPIGDGLAAAIRL